MLSRMRRHRNWLKWSLGFVCLAFVVFYIPDFLRDPAADLAATNSVAIVEGREITGTDFQRTYQSQLNAYRQAYGGNISERILRQLGVDQQILQQMVDEQAALAEADRLDIRVSDAEIRQRILSLPSLQENGVFIGEERYVQLLSAQRPPVTAAQFEENLRGALAIDKLRTMVTGWLSISDAEVEQEYRRRNEQVKLAVVSLPVDRFRPEVTATDDEVAKHFAAHEADFRIPEKRKIRFVLVDVDAIRARTVVPDAEIERAYNENFDQYSEPDQIRASHILFRLEGKDEAAVRAQAEEVLKQARAGADFGQLAIKYSQDEASAAKGGDLDFFGRGRMVPAFDNAAFALEEGGISDLVRTDFGFHIIKLTARKPGATRSIEEVRPEIVEQLSLEQAQAEAADIGERLASAVTNPAALDTAAAQNDLKVQESELFSRDEPILGIGMAPDVAARIFEMSDTDVSGAIATERGIVVATLAGRQDAYIPKLEEVRERVRTAVITEKAKVLAGQRGEELAAKLKGAASFEAAAKSAGFPAETTELITRDAPIPQLGAAPEVTKAAFGLPVGAVSGPIATQAGTAIVKVVEKQEVTAEKLASDKDRFREDLLADRRNRFFSAYMAKAKRSMRIEVNREALRRLVG
jgi:peptidyl-prolyl cis-trans isomerase D